MSSGPWPRPWETQALDGVNELLELQKCNWNAGLSGGMSQGLRPLPEKFLMHGVDVHPFTVQPASPDITLYSGLFIGVEQEGDTSTRQCSPWLEPPRAQALRVGSRHRASLIVVGSRYSSRLSRSNKYTGRGGVVISSIKYSTHPDIRSSLSHLIG